ncbi:MAG: four helix bundle protein [Deltaproteobacteria bacterium]|nr:four helix bundle protein [Deltaproteobacteria bacterium]
MQKFQCYQLSLGAVRLVRPLIERIEVHDRDLGRQLRRCLSSVPLNIAEGSRSSGRNRQARYANAMGSAPVVPFALPSTRRRHERRPEAGARRSRAEPAGRLWRRR